MNKLGFRVYITVVGCYLVRFLMFSNFDHFDLHNKAFCCVEEFTIKHQLKLDETSNIPLFNYGYRKCMFVNLGLKLQYQSQDLFSYYEDFLFWMWVVQVSRKNDVTLAPLCFSYLGSGSQCNSLGPRFCSQPIRSINFGVSLVLGPSVNPP